MAIRLGQKVDRVVSFLMGVNQPRIIGYLARYGFTQDEFDQGWKLLRAVAGDRLNAPAAPTRDPEAIERLDDWENKWFPIIKAALEHRHPTVHDDVFRNLSQTEGPELAITMNTLIQRIQMLKQGSDTQKEAHDLLTRRGVTDDIIKEAVMYLERLGQVTEPPAVDLDKMRAEQKGAEDAMWSWYREWSTIARQTITDGRLLQQLGFRNTRRTPKTDDTTTDTLDGAVD